MNEVRQKSEKRVSLGRELKGLLFIYLVFALFSFVVAAQCVATS